MEGRVGRLAGDLLHWSYRDFSDQLERIQEFSRVQAAALHAQGRRTTLYDWAVRPPLDFLRAYVLKQGFRDGFPGFAIAAATAFHAFLKWAKLWELERLGAPQPGAAAGKAARARGA